MIHLSLLVLTIFLFTRQGSSQCCKNLKAGICLECPEKMHSYMGNCIFDIMNCVSYNNGLFCERCKDGFTPSKEKTSCQRNGRLANTKEQYFQVPLFDQAYKDTIKILEEKVKQSRPNIAGIQLYTAASTREKENQKVRLIYSTDKGFLEIGFKLQNNIPDSKEIYSSLYEIGSNEDYANLNPDEQDKIKNDVMEEMLDPKTIQLVDCFKSVANNQINFRVFLISQNEGLIVKNITKKIQRLEEGGVSLNIEELTERFNNTIKQALRFKFLTKQFENAKLIRVVHIQKQLDKSTKNIFNLTYMHMISNPKNNNSNPTSYLLFENVTGTGKFQLIQYSIFNKTTRYEIYNGGQPTFQEIFNMTIQENIKANSITDEKVFFDIEKICNQKYEYETKNGAISRSGRGQNQSTIIYQIQFDKVMPQNKSIISTFTFAIDTKNYSLGLLYYTVFEVSKMKIRKFYDSTREESIKKLTGFTKTIYNILQNQLFYDPTSKLISIVQVEYDSKTRFSNVNETIKRIVFTCYFPDSKNKYEFLRFRYDIIGGNLIILPNSLVPNQIFINLDDSVILDYNLTAVLFDSVGKVDAGLIQTVKRFQSKERIKVYRILLRFTLQKQIKQGMYQITPFENVELKLSSTNLPPAPPPAPPRQQKDNSQSKMDIGLDRTINTSLTQRQVKLNSTIMNIVEYLEFVMFDRINKKGLKFMSMKMMTNKIIKEEKLEVFYLQYANENFTSGYYFIIGIYLEFSQIQLFAHKQLPSLQSPYFKQCCRCDKNESKTNINEKSQALRKRYEAISGNMIKDALRVQEQNETLLVIQITGRQIQLNQNEIFPKIDWQQKEKLQNVSAIDQSSIKKVISEITGDQIQVIMIKSLNIRRLIDLDRYTIQYEKMDLQKDIAINSKINQSTFQRVVIFQAEKHTISLNKNSFQDKQTSKSNRNESALKSDQLISQEKGNNIFNITNLAKVYSQKTFFPNALLEINQKQLKKYPFIPIKYYLQLNQNPPYLRLNYQKFQEPVSLQIFNLPTKLVETYPQMLASPFYKRSSNNSRETIYICNHKKFGTVNIVFDEGLNEILQMEFIEEGYYISNNNYFELEKYKEAYLAQKGIRILTKQIFDRLKLSFSEAQERIYDPLMSWKVKTFNLIQMIETVYYVSGYVVKANSLIKKINETSISITITQFESVQNKIQEYIEESRLAKQKLMDKVKQTREFKVSETLLKQKYPDFLAYSNFQNIIVIKYPSQIIFNVLYQTPYGILPASLLYNIKTNISSILNFGFPKQIKIRKNLEVGCKSMSNTGRGCLECQDGYTLFRNRVCFKKIKRCAIQIGDICLRCQEGFKKRSYSMNYCI